MKQMLAVFILLSTFGIFLYTTVPSITEDDSGELSGVGATLGIAHSPGYPLYSLAGKLAVTLIPFGSYAYRVNIVSSMFIALTGIVLFFAALEISQSLIIGFIVSLLFSFSGLVWAMGNTTEVYGIAAFLTSLICLVVIKSTHKVSYILVFYLLGLGMCAHYTIGLLLPGLVWWFGANYINTKDFNLKQELTRFKYYLPNIIVFGLLGLSALLFVFIRAKAEPVFSWEDPQTLTRFWQVIARLRYGSMSLAQGGAPVLSLPVIFGKLMFFFNVIIENFTIIGFLLFVYGVFICFKDRFKGWALLLLLIGSGPGFLILANVTIDPGSADLLKRFFFLPFVFLAMIIAFALKKMPKALSSVSLFLPIFMLYNNFPQMNTRQHYIYYDYAKNILHTVPQNTILLSDRADEMEFGVAYLHTANRRRPDIEFVDCNAGVTKSIYGNDYYRIWGKPRLAIRETVEKRIIEQTIRNVYYATFEPSMVNIPRFQEGLLYRAKPIHSLKHKFPYEEIYSLRRPKEGLSKREVNLLLSHFDLLGKYYLEMNEPVIADKFFNSLSLYDDKGFWNNTIGFLFHSRGQLDIAQKYYVKAINRKTADTETFINLGAIYEAKGEKEKAKEVYTNILSLEPNNAQTHYNLAVLYWKDSNWKAVVLELETVLKLKPDHADAKRFLEQARSKL